MKLNCKKIEPDSSFIKNRNLIYNEIDEEIIILSVDNGEYYTLNKIGSEIWNLLEIEQTFAQIINYLLINYDTNKEQCSSDTLEYLEDMIDNGIIQSINE